MKPTKCLKQILVLGMLAVPLTLTHAAPSPFDDGVKRVQLTPEERDSLIEYANNSKTLLEKAIEKAKGKHSAEANGIYSETITQVVLASFQNQKRKELLLRMTLNQALELTVGIPTPDGVAIQKIGVLAGTPYADLITNILEDSIKMALSYYSQDEIAIKAGSLVDLPYAELALNHLTVGREWLSGVQDWEKQLEFEGALLEQWNSVMMQEDHLRKAKNAEMILEVEKELKAKENTRFSVSQKVRLLRGVMTGVIGKQGVLIKKEKEDQERKKREDEERRKKAVSAARTLLPKAELELDPLFQRCLKAYLQDQTSLTTESMDWCLKVAKEDPGLSLFEDDNFSTCAMVYHDNIHKSRKASADLCLDLYRAFPVEFAQFSTDGYSVCFGSYFDKEQNSGAESMRYCYGLATSNGGVARFHNYKESFYDCIYENTYYWADLGPARSSRGPGDDYVVSKGRLFQKVIMDHASRVEQCVYRYDTKGHFGDYSGG